GSDLYLSPLVKSIAQNEKISDAELQTIKGSGLDGRITKEDILSFVANRTAPAAPQAVSTPSVAATPSPAPQAAAPVSAPMKLYEGDEVIQMDRVRKIIAD
ncbi:E3 binding domain-containing protein, partial [Kaistella carnis]|uniref:E3 binding domain-containing protein n=1 Tax=Kaistella carnis TaxID=1241979 RepID=UPI0028A9EAE3